MVDIGTAFHLQYTASALWQKCSYYKKIARKCKNKLRCAKMHLITCIVVNFKNAVIKTNKGLWQER
jgi:hypothetical protein